MSTYMYLIYDFNKINTKIFSLVHSIFIVEKIVGIKKMNKKK